MGTGHYDIDGTAVREGDILVSVNNPNIRGVVVRSAGRYFVECGEPPETFTYHIDDARDWRVASGFRQTADPVK